MAWTAFGVVSNTQGTIVMPIFSLHVTFVNIGHVPFKKKKKKKVYCN